MKKEPNEDRDEIEKPKAEPEAPPRADETGVAQQEQSPAPETPEQAEDTGGATTQGPV